MRLSQCQLPVYCNLQTLFIAGTCENFCTFCALTVFILLCKYFFLENVEKRLTVGRGAGGGGRGGFRECLSGYSKHNFFFA